jgi:sugar phosphate isomerase/epimerase
MIFPSKRAYHVVYDVTLEDALRHASENNWTAIVPDISVPRFSPHLYSRRDREHLNHLSSELEIGWGFHAPGDDVNLSARYPSIRAGISEYFKSIIDFARDLSSGVTNVVIHAGDTPHFRKANAVNDDFAEDHAETYRTALISIISELIDYGSPDVLIVLENHKWGSIVYEVIDELISTDLKLCLDIPKLFASDLTLRESDWRVFERNSDAIEIVHVHDWISDIGSHQIVGSGSIDFTDVLSFLSRIPRNLQYVFEVRPREAALLSLNNFNSLLGNLGLSL